MRSSAGRPSSGRNACQSAVSASRSTRRLPTSRSCSSSANSPMAGSGRVGARPPMTSASGWTTRATSPAAVSRLDAATTRPSAPWIAGCVAGYSDTARAAAFTVRANSVSAAACSALIGPGAITLEAINARERLKGPARRCRDPPTRRPRVEIHRGGHVPMYWQGPPTPAARLGHRTAPSLAAGTDRRDAQL